MSEIKIPEYIYGAEGGYYVHGHDPENLRCIDDPAELDWKKTWMRPVPMSQIPAEERGDLADEETLTRDERGRFAPVYWWEVCAETSAGAEPFLEAHYPRLVEWDGGLDAAYAVCRFLRMGALRVCEDVSVVEEA